MSLHFLIYWEVTPLSDRRRHGASRKPHSVWVMHAEPHFGERKEGILQVLMLQLATDVKRHLELVVWCDPKWWMIGRS